MNIVIMAGGGGTRLWPVSRETFPKQFTQLFGKKTLLQHTYDRAKAIVRATNRIVITTRAEYVKEIRTQLPRHPQDHILVESVKRDTAPSIGMAAAFFAAQGKHDEPLILMPSDHAIGQENVFRSALRAMGNVIQNYPDHTVLLGSRPTYPETGYGYIELGTKRVRMGGLAFRTVKRFREKPSIARAKKFVDSGNFVWNMGVYGWRVGTLLQLLHTFAPEIAQRLDGIEELFRSRPPARATGKSATRIARIYKTMPKISIDYAVTDRQDPRSLLVLPGTYGWSDVGHWGALEELLGAKEGVELKRGAVVQVHSTGNFVYSAADMAIGLAGVENLVIVSTPDAVLVCHRDHVQDVKKLVEELERKGHHRFL